MVFNRLTLKTKFPKAIKPEQAMVAADPNQPESPISGKDRFLKQLDDFKLGIDVLGNLMTEMESAHECAETLLLKEFRKKEEALEAKESATAQLEESLNAKIRELISELNEKDERLKGRDGRLDELRSEVGALTERLAETEVAREQAQRSLQDELTKRGEVLERKDAAFRDVKENLTAKIRLLGNQLGEKDEVLKSRDRQLETLEFEVNTLTGRVTATESAKEHAESLLRDEIKRREEMVGGKDVALRDLEMRLNAKIRDLGSQISEEKELLRMRDSQLEELRLQVSMLSERLTETESAKARAESLLQDEIKKREEMLQARDSATWQLKEKLSATVQTLGSEVTEQEELLRARSEQLEELRAEVYTLTERLAAMESAKEQAESLLQDELRRREEMVQVKESAIRIREVRESLNAKMQNQDTSAGDKKPVDPFEILLGKSG